MIEPTSAAQFAASTDGGLPPFERITDDTWSLALPLPPSSSTTVPFTLCYLLLDSAGGVHLVDPGFGSDENAARLHSALAELGGPRVASVVVSHLHPDHLGLAARVREETGARVLMHERERRAMIALTDVADPPFAEWGVPADQVPVLPPRLERGYLSIDVDGVLEDGVLLDIPGRDIRVVFTPRPHARSHLSA